MPKSFSQIFINKVKKRARGLPCHSFPELYAIHIAHRLPILYLCLCAPAQTLFVILLFPVSVDPSPPSAPSPPSKSPKAITNQTTLKLEGISKCGLHEVQRTVPMALKLPSNPTMMPSGEWWGEWAIMGACSSRGTRYSRNYTITPRWQYNF